LKFDSVIALADRKNDMNSGL